MISARSNTCSNSCKFVKARKLASCHLKFLKSRNLDTFKHTHVIRVNLKYNAAKLFGT